MAVFESISSVGTLLGVGANVLCPKPSGLAVGDLMVSGAWINTGLTSVMSPPAGWTKVRQDEPGIGNPKGMLSFKFADAADVAATDFLFTQSAATSPPWLCAIYRVSGAAAIQPDNDRLLLLNDIVIGSIIVLLPALDTIADNVLMLRMLGYDTTGTEAIGGITSPGTDTLRAFEGGPFVGPGTSDIVGLWYTLNASPVSPPQTILSANVFMNGAAGRARSIQYAIGIAPQTFLILTQADIETRRRVLMSKGRNLVVIVASPSITQSDTPNLYLVKDPDAGVGGFGKPPESAADARGDANDGWKSYSYDDVGTAYNL